MMKYNSEDILTVKRLYKHLLGERGLELMDYYGEGFRHYHNFRHIKQMLDFLIDSDYVSLLSERQYRNLQIAILFHDVIYVPGATDNEEKSLQLFLDTHWNNKELKEEDIKEICSLISITKGHSLKKTDCFLKRLMVMADLNAFMSKDPNHCIEQNKKVYREYNPKSTVIYNTNTKVFFEAMLQKLEGVISIQLENNFRHLINYLQHPKLQNHKIAGFIYQEDMDLQILKKAYNFYDKVHVFCIKNGNNVNTKPLEDVMLQYCAQSTFEIIYSKTKEELLYEINKIPYIEMLNQHE